MSRLFRRIATAFAIVGPLVLLSFAALDAAGARINTTRSVPVGLYWTTDVPPTKGAYVLLCPPPAPLFLEARDRGYLAAGPCPGNLGLMFKKILAAKGDVIYIGIEGVRVNGILVFCSAPRKTDNAGRPLPQFRAARRPLGQSEILPMSDGSCTSFDARYYGPLQTGQIRAVVSPVLTW